MNTFKSYLRPTPKKTDDKGENASSQPVSSFELNISPTPSSAGGSRLATPTASSFPSGDFRNAPRESVNEIKSDVMVSWLYQQQLERLWASHAPGEGVVLKKARNNYACCPPSLADERDDFFDQIRKMNVRCAMTLSTRVIQLFLNRHQASYVPLSSGLRLQVLPSISHLPTCQRHHFGAFIQDRLLLVVWDDEPSQLLDRARGIELSLMKMIWDNNDEDPVAEPTASNNVSSPALVDGEAETGDLEQALIAEPRKTLLINAVIVGSTLMILIAALGLGWRNLAQEIAVDGSYTRLLLLLATPAQIFVSLFFMQVVIVNIAQIIGPISQLKANTKFYSGLPPTRLDRNLSVLPHVTIQMPVYKEGLNAVIAPTIMSLKAAISTYELQGGSANIFVNDDGMQLIPYELAQARREFYEEHNTGWVARPGHNPCPADGEKGFVRRGKFKKASNMNYALMISNNVEAKLDVVQRGEEWNAERESEAYEKALAEVLNEEEGRAWAEGNVRVGDYILIIDSDTRVPKDCLLEAVSEMEQCPDVGILQFSSGVMQVTDSWFENGVTFFTNLIYTAIRYTVANGDVSPFVGHNALLRWSALQSISFTDADSATPSTPLFWSESHVSEDFDMSLRLQCAGYLIRLASYASDGFQEGVSLTVYDELARWEKYAYGCNELLFHPFQHWLARGPFTPLFRKFLASRIRLTSKVTILAYIGTYYALGAAWCLTVANYFLVGWFQGALDHYYLDSFRVYFSLVIVFSGLGNVALAVLRYRLVEKGLFASLMENLKHLLLLTLFLGGISLHISQALLCHFFSIDMSWGATAKEVSSTTFFSELPVLLKKFRGTFIFCLLMSVVMVVMSGVGQGDSALGGNEGGFGGGGWVGVGGVVVVPAFWRIRDFVALWPLGTVLVCHFMLPVALNPALMMFTW